jgi:hypothetical protein
MLLIQVVGINLERQVAVFYQSNNICLILLSTFPNFTVIEAFLATSHEMIPNMPPLL